MAKSGKGGKGGGTKGGSTGGGGSGKKGGKGGKGKTGAGSALGDLPFASARRSSIWSKQPSVVPSWAPAPTVAYPG